MDKLSHKATPRDFFLYLGMIAALYASAVSLLAVKFQTINSLFPDVLEYISGADLGSLRVGISALTVAFPVFIILSRLIYRGLSEDPHKREFWIRRWLIYFTLFVSGATLAVLGIILINAYLQGEFTSRFLLKVLSVAVVAGVIFRYYLFDLKRDIKATAKLVRQLAWVTTAIVAGLLVGGFLIAGTPQNQRLVRLDQERVSNLYTIQDQILNAYHRDGSLPEDITTVLGSSGRPIGDTVDPVTDAPYEYRVISKESFELCATFDTATKDGNTDYRYNEPYIYPANRTDNFYIEGNFEHGEGRVCFERLIRLSADLDNIIEPKPAMR